VCSDGFIQYQFFTSGDGTCQEDTLLFTGKATSGGCIT